MIETLSRQEAEAAIEGNFSPIEERGYDLDSKSEWVVLQLQHKGKESCYLLADQDARPEKVADFLVTHGKRQRMLRAAARDYHDSFHVHLETLKRQGYRIKKLTPYQFRLNDRLDLYPVHRRFHDIKVNERGDCNDVLETVYRILGEPEKEAA